MGRRKRAAMCVAMVVVCAAVGGCGGDADDAVSIRDQPAMLQESAPAHPGLVTLDHHVPLGEDRSVFVRETFTASSWQRAPRRAILLLGGTPTTGEFYNVDVDGYRSRELIAERGFFAFTMDFEGSGQSTFPEDGFSLTFDALTASTLEVIDWIRRTRNVERVDVLGEAEGGGVALQLAADETRVRSCVASSMVFENGTDFFNGFFLSPFFQALIFGAPNGYLMTTPELYFNVLAAAPPEVAGWVLANQPGRYSMGMVAESLIEMPSGYDPTRARVPGLIIRGEHDQNAPPSDTGALAAAYGSEAGGLPAELAVIPGAMMIPRIEAPPHNDDFWRAVFDFVDP